MIPETFKEKVVFSLFYFELSRNLQRIYKTNTDLSYNLYRVISFYFSTCFSILILYTHVHTDKHTHSFSEASENR